MSNFFDGTPSKATAPCVDIFVAGQAAPQGSKRHVGNGIMVESSKAVEPWRESIRSALSENGYPKIKLAGAVVCRLEFIMRRPLSLPKRRTPHADKRPDLDKLCRAVFDAVQSAGVIEDDSRIIDYSASKRIALPGETAGLRLRINQAPEVE